MHRERAGQMSENEHRGTGPPEEGGVDSVPRVESEGPRGEIPEWLAKELFKLFV